MLKWLEEFFEKSRAKKLLQRSLKSGFRVDESGKIFVGLIELPPAKIARALNVDRRVVIQTAKEISENEQLLAVFRNLEPRAFLGNAARQLGFDAIEIRAEAKKRGIVAVVAKILADDKITIRQITADDPQLFPDPVMTIIVDGKLKAGTLRKLRELPVAKSILIK